MKTATVALNSIINSGIKIAARAVGKRVFAEDCLITTHNHDFLQDEVFINAYARGMKAANSDYNFRWRVHLAIWAASSASKLDGDFVECGVNYGFISSAIMSALDWNTLNKRFFLLDTFTGLDDRLVSASEKKAGYLKQNDQMISSGYYVSKVDAVKRNFAEWKNVSIVPGSVPETLSKVETDKIAFLHLDMNCSFPEVAALKKLWSKIVAGGFVLLDDYAYPGFKISKLGMDELALELNVRILSLPTGQGLLIKPPQ